MARKKSTRRKPARNRKTREEPILPIATVLLRWRRKEPPRRGELARMSVEGDCVRPTSKKPPQAVVVGRLQKDGMVRVALIAYGGIAPVLVSRKVVRGNLVIARGTTASGLDHSGRLPQTSVGVFLRSASAGKRVPAILMPAAVIMDTTAKPSGVYGPPFAPTNPLIR